MPIVPGPWSANKRWTIPQWVKRRLVIMAMEARMAEEGGCLITFGSENPH